MGPRMRTTDQLSAATPPVRRSCWSTAARGAACTGTWKWTRHASAPDSSSSASRSSIPRPPYSRVWCRNFGSANSVQQLARLGDRPDRPRAAPPTPDSSPPAPRSAIQHMQTPSQDARTAPPDGRCPDTTRSATAVGVRAEPLGGLRHQLDHATRLGFDRDPDPAAGRLLGPREAHLQPAHRGARPRVAGRLPRRSPGQWQRRDRAVRRVRGQQLRQYVDQVARVLESLGLESSPAGRPSSRPPRSWNPAYGKPFSVTTSRSLRSKARRSRMRRSAEFASRSARVVREPESDAEHR